MRRFFIFMAESIKAFSYDNCLTMAAAIAFYALFSLIPLMFLFFSFIGFILGTETWLFERILEFVKESLPYLSDSIVEDIKGLINNRKVFGWLGIGLLVWGVFLIWCAVFLISIGLPVAAEILSKLKISVWGIDISYYITKSISFKYFLPVVIMVIAVAFIFKIFAGRNIKLRHAVLASIIFSVLWETAKHLFALYLAHFGSFNMMYGSLGAIMIMLLWIFYSAVILLFSAEIISCLRTVRRY